MNIKTLSFLFITLILSACSPFTIVSSSGEQPTPVVVESTAPPAGYQPVTVDHVDVEVGVGSPIPVRAIVSGNLPSSCAQLGEMRLRRDGTTFYVELLAYQPTQTDCIQDAIPFLLEIPLNIVNLPKGPYQVIVNGTTASFDPNAVPAGAVITLERTVCFGFCPIYTLTIYSDGKVEYEGREHVTVKGSQTGSITPGQVQELVDAFQKAGYFNLKDEYISPVTDLPTTITSLTLNGQTKMIRNYGGCLTDSSVKAPQALCDLETRIDEVTNSIQWIGKP